MLNGRPLKVFANKKDGVYSNPVLIHRTKLHFT